MAGSAGSKYRDVFLKYAIRLCDKDDAVILTDEFFMLLQQIHIQGSIVAGAQAQGISFRKAWNLLKQSETRLGLQLVIPQRGGQRGGHTQLSTDGHRLLQAYTELVEKFDESTRQITRKFFHTINNPNSI